jgi:hypothetical protein
VNVIGDILLSVSFQRAFRCCFFAEPPTDTETWAKACVREVLREHEAHRK